MTNREAEEIALIQSAYDFGCEPEDFLSDKNKTVLSRSDARARKYLSLPFECDMVSYGPCIVAQTSERLFGTVNEYLSKYDASHCFETPHIHELDARIQPFGLKTCFMAEYFLPDVNCLKERDCGLEIRILTKDGFEDLYTDEWSNALCKKRKELDVLAAAAYDGGRLAGLAGCSADCENMYQIGIDVLPQYRRRGIAAALTSRLALEILEMGKVPFYCAAWCNLKSVKNAVKCGFRPAWVSLTAREISLVEELNRK